MKKKKTIVTHINPDLDGIPAIWLLKKFDPDFKDAELRFVPAGSRFDDLSVDPETVVHVDTGGGPYDHHDTNNFTCAAKLVWEDLKKRLGVYDEAIDRMIVIINEYDHAKDNEWPEPNSDRYEFSLNPISMGWKMMSPGQNYDFVEWTIHALEAIYRVMSEKVKAEEELKSGQKFETVWGTGVAIETHNDSVLDQGMKMGYAVVVRRDPARGFIRVTASTPKDADLTEVYEKILKLDSDSDWFLHASKVLLRNGSSRNPNMKATKLSLQTVVKLLEEQN